MAQGWGPAEVCAQLGAPEDLVMRRAEAGGQLLDVLFLDGVCAGGEIAELILRPLAAMQAPLDARALLEHLVQGSVYCATVRRAEGPAEAAELLVGGWCALIPPEGGCAVCFEVKTPVRRSPSPPESENTVKGAKDAFTETLRINTSLLRRHLQTTQLRLAAAGVGSCARTAVTVCWIEGVTDPSLVARLQARLRSIRTEGFLSPAAVEESVTGARATAFPLLQYTERTDTFCQGLLSGQAGLLVDGLPLGYLLPVCLGRLMTSPEDRAVDYVSATCLRILRYAALLCALALPAVYVAMAEFHQEMIPTSLLLAIIESKRDVPFPTLLEVLGLLAAFELLQEAGLHLPQAIGTAVSIIGGLVVGTAAVDARLVSPAALIVTASSGICGFTLPSRDLSDAVRVWRFALTALAGYAGLFGAAAGFVLLGIHLSGLTSLGVGYLAPFSDVRVKRALLRSCLRQTSEEEENT